MSNSSGKSSISKIIGNLFSKKPANSELAAVIPRPYADEHGRVINYGPSVPTAPSKPVNSPAGAVIPRPYADENGRVINYGPSTPAKPAKYSIKSTGGSTSNVDPEDAMPWHPVQPSVQAPNKGGEGGTSIPSTSTTPNGQFYEAPAPISAVTNDGMAHQPYDAYHSKTPNGGTDSAGTFHTPYDPTHPPVAAAPSGPASPAGADDILHKPYNGIVAAPKGKTPFRTAEPAAVPVSDGIQHVPYDPTHPPVAAAPSGPTYSTGSDGITHMPQYDTPAPSGAAPKLKQPAVNSSGLTPAPTTAVADGMVYTPYDPTHPTVNATPSAAPTDNSPAVSSIPNDGIQHVPYDPTHPPVAAAPSGPTYTAGADGIVHKPYGAPTSSTYTVTRPVSTDGAAVYTGGDIKPPMSGGWTGPPKSADLSGGTLAAAPPSKSDTNPLEMGHGGKKNRL